MKILTKSLSTLPKPQKNIMSLDSFLDCIFEDQQLAALKDRTKPFFMYLASQSKNQNFVMFLYIKANVREGKSYMSFVVGFWLLRYDKFIRIINGIGHHRTICLWRASEGFLELIQKYCPPEFRNRIYIADIIHDIRPNSFVIIDEGIAAMDKYSDDKADARNWTESQVQFGHWRVSIWASSQSNDLSVSFRKLANFRAWKKLNNQAMQYNQGMDDFEKTRANGGRREDICQCPKQKTIFTCTLSDFTGDGYLFVDHNDLNDPYHLQWWNEEISSNSALGDIDASIVKARLFKIKMDKVVSMALKSDNILEWENRMNIKEKFMGWIQTEKELESLYNELNSQKERLLQYFLFRLDHDALPKDTRKIHASTSIDRSWTFSRYLEENIIDKKEGQCISNFVMGMNDADNGKNIGKGTQYVIEKRNYYQENLLGDEFEKYFKLRFGYDLPRSQQNIADLEDFEGRIFEKNGIYSIKFNSKSRSNELEYSIDTDFRPEKRTAELKSLDHYYVVIYRPQWKQGGIYVHKQLVSDTAEKVNLKLKQFIKKIVKNKVELFCDF